MGLSGSPVTHLGLERLAVSLTSPIMSNSLESLSRHSFSGGGMNHRRFALSHRANTSGEAIVKVQYPVCIVQDDCECRLIICGVVISMIRPRDSVAIVCE